MTKRLRIAPADIQEHLNNIGPDDRGHAAFEGVEQASGTTIRTIEAISPVPRMMEITMEIAKTRTPFGERPQNQEMCRGEFADALAEPPLHQFVGGEHLAAEVVRQEQDVEMTIRASR